jgi:hypothetical protein
MQRKPPEDEQLPEAEREEHASVIGTVAVVPKEREDALKEVIEKLGDAGKTGGGLSMNSILSMDSSSVGIADVLQIPVGGKETDMYRWIERTRLTPRQKGLYSKAIWRAEHGLGWGPLDRTIPALGDFMILQIRSALSVDGASLQVFENTVSVWSKALYEKQSQADAQRQRGISQ